MALPESTGLEARNAPAVLAPDRLEALAATDLLDSPAEDEFDRITTLACQFLNVPVSIVALIDAGRSYFKSAAGLPALPPDRTVPLSHSLCQHVVGDERPFRVDDARTHELARANGAVTDLGAGAYLGVPLRAPSGHILGTLCAADFDAHVWTDEQLKTLSTLAATLECEIALRAELTERRRTESEAAAKAEVLAAVVDVNASLAAELDPERLVRSVVDASRLATGAAFAAFFYTTEPTERPAYLFAVSGAPRAAFERFGPVRMTPIFEPSFSGRESVRIADVLADERFGKMGGMPKGHLPVRSYLSVPVRDREGGVFGALLFGHPEAGVFDDLAEQAAWALADQAAITLQNARLYQRLQDSTERHSSLLATLDDIVFQMDGHGRFIYLNAAWEVKTGYTVEETVGRSFFAFSEPDSLQVLTAAIQAASQERETLEAFLHEHEGTTIRTADGSLLHTEIRWRVRCNEEGAVIGAVGTMHDVTDTVRYRAERRAREQAETARAEAERMSRLRDAFLRNISHEVRTPLTVMMGSAELLFEEIPDTHLELQEFAHGICIGGSRLMRTFDNVLDLAQIEAGQLHAEPRATDVGLVVEAVIETMRPLAKVKGLTLVVEDAAPQYAVRCDPYLLQRILDNLVGNAIKFTERGSVTVRIGDVRGSGRGDFQRNQSLTIVVEDTGVGVPEDALPYLFEAFQQASADDSRSHEGCGIGLAIVQQAVRLLGGQVEAESVVGEGSRFGVTLPAPAIVDVESSPFSAPPEAGFMGR